jgi:riboflavin kinase/FMN adenylyltransferase
MRIVRSTDAEPPAFGPAAVTIGKFDGVHLGHRAVIDALVEHARRSDLTSVIVTFDRNPLEILAPERCPQPLAGFEQELELLSKTGADAAFVLVFDTAMSQLTAEEFIRRYLVDTLQVRSVLVGRDFRFGRGGAGSVATLRELGERFGYSVHVIEDVAPEGARVSSTNIRRLLADGEVAHAARLLGRAPSVRGTVVHGAKRGRQLGFPTANLAPDPQGFIPADGVYAGWLVDAGTTHPAAISVGNNPTFEGVAQKQVEAYVLDSELDLYDHVVDIAFEHRIRGMVAFQGVPALIAQMHDDVARARELLELGADARAHAAD